MICVFLTGQVKDFRDLPHRLPPALEPKGDKITSKVDKTRINSADKERINSIEKDRITITIGEEKSKVSSGAIMLCWRGFSDKRYTLRILLEDTQ